MVGKQQPRIKIEPHRVNSDGQGAALLMSEYGSTLDEWQQLILDCWLGVDELGRYNVTSAGLSVSRQNGKNVCIEARELYGLIVNGDRILHTAHQVRTTKKAFRRLANIFTDKSHPELNQIVKKIRYGVGEESIELNNGGVIEFTSRSRQTARGFDGISLVIYDEAQELTDDQAEAITATLSASQNGTRQILYIGTPVYPGCPGEVFKRFRDNCIKAAPEDVKHIAWHEWSVPGDNISDIDFKDKKLWYEANPALGYRLTEEFTQTEAESLSPDGFCRERLGVWFKTVSEVQEEKAINEENWIKCKSSEAKPEGKTAYGVKFSADGSEVVLCGAVMDKETKNVRIELIERNPVGYGLKWIASFLNERYKKASCVVIDGRNGVDVLIDRICDVWRLKDSIIKSNSSQVITAASMLTMEIDEGTITWYEQQDELNQSAITATKRRIGSGWGLGGADSAPIEAAAFALYGVRTSKRDPSRVMRIG